MTGEESEYAIERHWNATHLCDSKRVRWMSCKMVESMQIMLLWYVTWWIMDRSSPTPTERSCLAPKLVVGSRSKHILQIRFVSTSWLANRSVSKPMIAVLDTVRGVEKRRRVNDWLLQGPNVPTNDYSHRTSSFNIVWGDCGLRLVFTAMAWTALLWEVMRWWLRRSLDLGGERACVCIVARCLTMRPSNVQWLIIAIACSSRLINVIDAALPH